jgi:hypothetical protein
MGKYSADVAADAKYVLSVLFLFVCVSVVRCALCAVLSRLHSPWITVRHRAMSDCRCESSCRADLWLDESAFPVARVCCVLSVSVSLDLYVLVCVCGQRGFKWTPSPWAVFCVCFVCAL